MIKLICNFVPDSTSWRLAFHCDAYASTNPRHTNQENKFTNNEFYKHNEEISPPDCHVLVP